MKPSSVAAALSLLASLCASAPSIAQQWQKVAQSSVLSDAEAMMVGNDGTLYLGGAHGLWRSADGGHSWGYVKPDTNVVSPHIPYIKDIAIGPGGTMLMGEWSGNLYASTDNAGSWFYCTPSQAMGSSGGRFTGTLSVYVGPNGEFYASQGPDAPDELVGVWKSSDHGATWIHTPLTGTDGSLGDVFVGPEGTLYAVDGFRLLGSCRLFRSLDDGVTWIASALPSQARADDMVGRDIWADDLGHVVIGCEGGVAYSADGGGTLARWRSEDGGTLDCMVGNSLGELFAAGWESAYSSCDFGQTWQDFSSGLVSSFNDARASIRALAVAPSDVLYAVMEGGEIFRTLSPDVGVRAAVRPPGPLTLESISPNPASGMTALRFQAPPAMRVAVEALDISGRRAGRWELTSTSGLGGSLMIATAAWAPGLYLVRVTSMGHSVVGRLLVVH